MQQINRRVGEAESRQPVDGGSDSTITHLHGTGSSMDRLIERKPRRLLQVVAGLAGAALAAGLIALVLPQLSDRSLKVSRERLNISAVQQGVFDDYIPLRANVTPKRTIFLDAMEGGRVDKILVEDGANLKAGELIAVLSNTSLQLNVAQNEALITEQLNNMRNIELQLEQNRLQHKRALVELDYQIVRLTRQLDRARQLLPTGAVRVSDVEDLEDELTYQQNRRTVTLESQSTDARLQENQLVYLRQTTAQLQQNVALARQNLESLQVRTPVAGKLSGFDIEIGQSVGVGGRLGQIDPPDEFKLNAGVDEFYLDRVDKGQRAEFEQGGQSYELTVSKIYPQVKNGQFEIDLTFVGAPPADIRRGQSISIKLILGDEAQALLLENGSFYQDTGGKWVFVLDEAGTSATRREVQLGRRNTRFIEVKSGLDAGERVITSAYSGYMDVERLKLQDRD